VTLSDLGRWRSDNPLARAVARIPLPIRAKQLIVSVAVAALLVLVAVLGLVALGQSNSRGAELRKLQQQAVYEQLLLTDANQLKEAIVARLRGPDNPVIGPRERKWIFYAYESRIGDEANRLCLDAGLQPPTGSSPPAQGTCAFRQPTPHLSRLRWPGASGALAASRTTTWETAARSCGSSPTAAPRPSFPTFSLFARTDGWARSRRNSRPSPHIRRPARTRSLLPIGGRMSIRGIC
jgi:type II secretory pathway pseudopilin PulG